MSVNKVILIGNVGREYINKMRKAYPFHPDWQKQPKNMCIKGINFMWKAKYVPVHTMTRPAQSAMLRKSLWTLWKC